MLTTHYISQEDKIEVETIGTKNGLFYSVRIGDMRFWSIGYGIESNKFMDELIQKLQAARNQADQENELIEKEESDELERSESPYSDSDASDEISESPESWQTGGNEDE